MTYPIESEDLAIDRLITTLKADLPDLFRQDVSYDIYTSDISFRDPVNRFKGKFSYRIVFWTLRFHAQLFFSQIFFDLHSVTPAKPDTILATWTVRGTLRLPWHPTLYFNGTSTYKFNTNYQIYDHVDTWDRSPIEILKQFVGKGNSK
ncbi:MAG TPA: DUF2358 domain-containing protein [Allocoleopsis sp.]